MRMHLNAPEALRRGVELLAPELDIRLCAPEDCELRLEVREGGENGLRITLEGGAAQIVYGGGSARFFRALGLLAEAVSQGKTQVSYAETPMFDSNGGMFDVSRNAVLRPDTVKYLLRRMALMGHSTFMLYTEDTYEIKERPYFGYMRGRYSQDEIRDMDAYAAALGIELIPCVQFLAHLATHLRWDGTTPYRDTETTLLVDEEETYRLIDDMLRAVAGSFTSRRLHMGMDEAHTMGLGAFLDRNGFQDRFETFCRHLNRVTRMAKSYGFRPMMWGDMFFRIASKVRGYYDANVEFPQSVLDSVPRDVQQIYWDYYHDNPATYEALIGKHRELSDNVYFSGGIWTWIGPCPHYRWTIASTLPALAMCRKTGVREVNATIWHNGADSLLVTSLPGLQLYAEYDYTGAYDPEALARRFAFCCGGDFNDFLLLEEPDHPDGGTQNVNPCRFMIFNDPMLGMFDAHVRGLDTQAYYTALAARLAQAGPAAGVLRPVFDYSRAMVDLLARKADFGIRLKTAYDAADRAALGELAGECQPMRRLIDALRLAHRAAWMAYHKPFGWEYFDAGYGMLMTRFSTTEDRIRDYLSGAAERLEELEQERLPFDCRTEPGDTPFFLSSKNIRFIYTASVT